jgi:hypothetical protein
MKTGKKYNVYIGQLYTTYTQLFEKRNLPNWMLEKYQYNWEPESDSDNWTSSGWRVLEVVKHATFNEYLAIIEKDDKICICGIEGLRDENGLSVSSRKIDTAPYTPCSQIWKLKDPAIKGKEVHSK